jgi:universal stress protein E
MTWRHILFAATSPGTIESSAMNKVARLANALEAQVELFHCVYDSDIARSGRFGSRGIAADIREIVAQCHRQLDVAAQSLRARGVRVNTAVRWDAPPHDGIVRQVLRHKPDLLVAQSTRRGRVARLMLTQTDYKLIETCPCPLLLIKTDRPYTNGCIVAAVDPAHAHEKPAALDDAILGAASAISQGLGVVLHVYHARAPWAQVVHDSAELRQIPQALESEIHAEYQQKCETEVIELASRQNVRAEHVHVEEGDASESLPRFATTVAADILVMGAVSRSRAKRVFIGHTAERVLDALDCDVLIAKPADFRSPVSRQSVHRFPKSGTARARYILA